MRSATQFSLSTRVLAAMLCISIGLPGWAQDAMPSAAQQSAPAAQAPAQQTAPEAPAPPPAQNQPAPTIAQQNQALSTASVTSPGVVPPFHVELQHSRNPFAPYLPTPVPSVNLTNSPRLENLERDGKLYLSLTDAIALAIENNLDLEYFRYNLPIAQADLARTKAGGQANGVNTGIVQGTAGGASSSGLGGGGGGGGVNAVGNGGIVTSTLGAGPAVNGFDPQVIVKGYVDHLKQIQVNTINYGVPIYLLNTIGLTSSYTQAYPLGTYFTVTDYGQRTTTNSIYNQLSPQLTANFNFTVVQPLLQGAGLAVNERFIKIAKQNLQITDLAFKAQTIATVTQVENIYWDLVNSYQDAQIKERSLAYANEILSDDQKQLDLQSIPAIQVTKDQAAVASAEGDLTVSKATLRLNELLIKNALTKTITDPGFADMPVIPLDLVGSPDPTATEPIEQLITEAEKNRPDVAEEQIQMQKAQNNLKSIKNALLPYLAIYGEYVGYGLAGQENPACQLGEDECNSTLPKGFGGALKNTFNYSSPEYQVGFSLTLTLRNRVAKADQFRAVLDFRQNELQYEQQKKTILLDVRNSAYALQQAQARVIATQKARDLAQKSFDIAKQEQKLGAMSTYDTLTSEQALAVAESALVVAQTAFEKAKVDIDRVAGSTLDRMGVSIDDAKSGVVSHLMPPPQPTAQQLQQPMPQQ